MEKVFIFADYILCKKKSAKFTCNIKPIMLMSLKYWEEYKYNTRTKEIEDSVKEDGRGTSVSTIFNVDSTGRKFNSVVLSEKLWPTMKLSLHKTQKNFSNPMTSE